MGFQGTAFFVAVVFAVGSFSLVCGQETSNSFSSEIGSFYSDQTEYETSRTSDTIVKIHGQIIDVSRATKVVIVFTLPDGSKTGNHVFTTDNGEFETLFPMNHNSQKGLYSVFASYNGIILGQIEFTVTEKPPESPFVTKPTHQEQNQTVTEDPREESPEEPPEEQSPQTLEDTGSYELQDGNLIYYSIDNGNLLGMSLDKNSVTLSADVSFFGDGKMTVGIPRQVIDAKENGNDSNFIVLINGNQVGYSIVQSNQYDRVIAFDLGVGTSHIEIIGTQMEEQTPQSEKQVIRVYVSDIPAWEGNLDDTVTNSLNYWEAEYPNLKFEQVGQNDYSDFFVSWVKEFGVEHVGYAFQNKFVEVGLGDSNCRGKWQPYSSEHVGYILKHEIGHIIGLAHNPDQNSIMYPVAQNREYGVETEDLVLTSGYGRYIPLCTVHDSTSYDISITTDDPNYGFNAYVVPSQDQFQSFLDGKSIEYFKNDGCYKENTLNFNGACKAAKGNGIILTINDKQTKGLTNISVKLQEKSLTGKSVVKQSLSPVCGPGTMEQNGICVPAKISSHKITAKEGQWVKYTLSVNTDATNDFVGMIVEAALAKALQNGDTNLNNVDWIKSEVTSVSQTHVSVQSSVHSKNGEDSAFDVVGDIASPAAINWVIPTDYEIGDIVFNDSAFGEAKVVGMPTKTYGKKSFETIEVRSEKSTTDGANIVQYTTVQNFDKKTGIMLGTLVQVKAANAILGGVTMSISVKAIDSYTPSPENSGCLIATAAFGSELAPQVQMLREIRDSVLFSTNSGTVFMTGFNEFYYSFSPYVADYERQNPVFKKMVQISITPMLSTLSILNYVDVDSEQEVLGYGIGIILLNAGMYFVAPTLLIFKLRNYFKK